MKSVGTVDQLVTAVTVSSLLCQRTFQADSNPRPHSCLRPACKITMIVLLHCGRGGAGADTSRWTQARSGPMCSLHRGYYGHYHTGTLLGHNSTTGSRAPGPRPPHPLAWARVRGGGGGGDTVAGLAETTGSVRGRGGCAQCAGLPGHGHTGRAPATSLL